MMNMFNNIKLFFKVINIVLSINFISEKIFLLKVVCG